MKSLKHLMEDQKIYKAVLADSINVLDNEVSKRSGLGGMAIKGAYKMVKGVKQGKLLQKVIAALIPEFIEELEPFYIRFQKEGKGSGWSDFLRPDYDTIADLFLKVTDTKAKESTNKTARGAYEKMRPKAKKEVMASMPAMNKLMGKYL